MKAFEEISRLIIPVDLSYLHAVQAFVDEVARKADFSEDECTEIEVGLEEAFTNVVQHAFGPGERAEFELEVRLCPVFMELIIKDKGIPFDPKRIPSYQADKPDITLFRPGLGTFLIRKMMDEVSFHNLGKKGKELHLIKYRPSLIPQSSEETESAQSDETTCTIVDAEEELELRSVEPSEAIEVARLLYRCYGYTYFYERFYLPEQLIPMMEHGLVASVGAFTPKGELVGHVALFRNESIGSAALFGQSDESLLAEPAAAVVRPEYRGKGLLPRLTTFLIERTSELFPDLAGLFIPPVTSHTYSQKTVYQLDFKNCGILVGYYPKADLKSIQDVTPQRVTLVLTYRLLVSAEQRTIYPPDKHREIIKDIYKNLGLEIVCRRSPHGLSREKGRFTHMTTRAVKDLGNASIKIKSYGDDTIEQVEESLKTLHQEGTEAILLYLNLREPQTAYMAIEFEKLGFFFSGVPPETSQGDSLLMMHMNVKDYDFDKIRLRPEKAKEYLAYIRDARRP